MSRAQAQSFTISYREKREVVSYFAEILVNALKDSRKNCDRNLYEICRARTYEQKILKCSSL